MKKLLFIFNPHSGKGMIKNHIAEILDIFTKSGYEVTVRPTQAALDAYNYIKSYGDEYDRIVVSGGDGTLNEAVKGIMTFDISQRKELGYIPAGTTNDVATTLGIPKNMIEAAKIAVEGKAFPCDIGQFNDETFNYVAAFGAFTEVSYDTPQETKNALGHIAYLLEGIKLLPNLTSHHVKIKHDNGEFEGDIFLCIILNSTSVAGIHNTNKIIDTDLNDGLFEMVAFKRATNLHEFQSILSGLIKGEKEGDGYVILKSSYFEFESEDNIKWTLDGEFGGSTSHAEVNVLHSAMTYIV